MSEIKAKIILTLDENEQCRTEIVGKGRTLIALLATAFLREDCDLLELVEHAINVVKMHQNQIDQCDETKFMAVINDILANHKPSNQ
jgi:hypothetical protein